MVGPVATSGAPGVSSRLQVLAALGDAISQAPGLPAVAALLARSLPSLCEFDHVALAVRAADGRLWAVVSSRAAGEEPGWALVNDPGSPLLAAASATVPVRVERAAGRLAAGPATPDGLSAAPSALCWPLRGPEGPLGTFGLFGAYPGACANADPALLQVLSTLIEQTARRLVLLEDQARLQRELERVEKLKVDIASLFVADLRGPLAVLDSGLDFLDQVLLPPEADEARAFVRELRLAATQLGDLAGNLVEVARLEEGGARADLRPVALGPWLQERVGRHAQAARVGELRLTSRAEPADAMGIFDPGLLARVVDNLLGNSLRNTPRRGQVTLVARRAGPEVTLAVADTGPGIPPEDRERLFTKYGQIVSGGKMTRAGRGLGFYLCKLVVELHGGAIVVEDGPGGGPLFRVTLPAAPA